MKPCWDSLRSPATKVRTASGDEGAPLVKAFRSGVPTKDRLPPGCGLKVGWPQVEPEDSQLSNVFV